MTQEIFSDAIVPGWYTLTAQIYYRDGNYENHAAKYVAGEELTRNAFLIAGEGEGKVTGNVPFITDYANKVPGLGRSMHQAHCAIPTTAPAQPRTTSRMDATGQRPSSSR